MKVNQKKNYILNNNVMTMKTHMILSYYTPPPGATPTLFHPKQVKAVCFSTKEWNLFQSK